MATEYVGKKVRCERCPPRRGCASCAGRGYVIECREVLDEAECPPSVALVGVVGFYVFRAILVAGLAAVIIFAVASSILGAFP
jgi:hypothetical protein